MIDAGIATYSASVPLPPRRIQVPGQPGPGIDPTPSGGSSSSPGAAVAPGDGAVGGTGCACSFGSRSGNAELALALLGATFAATRRRRRTP
jgi:MYXO-CTERM domain-containing protein